jgi:hypothetical protein
MIARDSSALRKPSEPFPRAVAHFFGAIGGGLDHAVMLVTARRVAIPPFFRHNLRDNPAPATLC